MPQKNHKLIRLPYGVKSGTLTHISNVESGLSCNCSCPACDKPLVAKKGSLREHHFAHAGQDNCIGATETALHLAAKEILSEEKSVVLPAVELQLRGPHPARLLSHERRYVIEEIKLERRVGDIIPDLLVRILDRWVAIEIYVTHQVDSSKIARLREMGLSTIEIDLSNAPRDLRMPDIKPLLVEGGSHKKWIYNAAAEKRLKMLLLRAMKLKTKRRGFALHVDGCPISVRKFRGKPYANVLHDCNGCEFALDIDLVRHMVICDGNTAKKL